MGVKARLLAKVKQGVGGVWCEGGNLCDMGVMLGY